MRARTAAAAGAACVFIAVAAAAPAVAQEQQGICVTPPPSFAPTPANRLSCRDFVKLRRTHNMVAIRTSARQPSCQIKVTNLATGRDDGSFVTTCQMRCDSAGRRQGFDWRPCPPTRDAKYRAEGRTTGAGTCSAGVFCVAMLGVWGERQSCYAIHREGERYAVVRMSGLPACNEGDVSMVPR